MADVTIDPLRDYFLQRLQRLLTRRMLGAPVMDDADARFIDQAIFATYRDLDALGFAWEAGILIRHYREQWQGRR